MSSQPDLSSVAGAPLRAGLAAGRGLPVVIASWLFTRIILLSLLAGREHYIFGDVDYYLGKVAALAQTGLAHTLPEYPTPVVWILGTPFQLGFQDEAGYRLAFVGSMLLLDAAFTYAIWRAAGRRSATAVHFWIWFVFLLGPLCYVRIDLIPAVLVGGALLAARARPLLAGVLLGAGAAVKLWPALLFPPLLSRRDDRKSITLGFIGTGFGLALISLLAGGPSRLFSPLTWQSDRGLQIESVWATPSMLLRSVQPAQWQVEYSNFNAYEVFGPGVEIWHGVSDLATVVGLLAIVLLWVRALRRSAGLSANGLALVGLATIAIVISTNKTLSPQYLLWLAGPLVLLLLPAVDDNSQPIPAGQARLRAGRAAIGGLLLAGLTHLVYPVLYGGLLGFGSGSEMLVATVVLVTRNLLLLAFTGYALYAAWLATRPKCDKFATVSRPNPT